MMRTHACNGGGGRSASRRSSLAKDEHGGALIEVALLMPVCCMLVFGVAQFGVLLLKYASASYAAESGVRYASLHSGASQNPTSDTLIKQAVRNNLLFDQAAWSITTNWATANTIGATVSVVVSNTYNVALPFSRTRQITIGSTAKRLIVR